MTLQKTNFFSRELSNWRIAGFKTAIIDKYSFINLSVSISFSVKQR